MVGNFWYSGRAILSRFESGTFANSPRALRSLEIMGNTIVILFLA